MGKLTHSFGWALAWFITILMLIAMVGMGTYTLLQGYFSTILLRMVVGYWFG